MNEEKINMSVRKFLKEVGVTSQRELEKTIRGLDGQNQQGLKVKMVLTAEGTDLNHVVEGAIDLGAS